MRKIVSIALTLIALLCYAPSHGASPENSVPEFTGSKIKVECSSQGNYDKFSFSEDSICSHKLLTLTTSEIDAFRHMNTYALWALEDSIISVIPYKILEPMSRDKVNPGMIYMHISTTTGEVKAVTFYISKGFSRDFTESEILRMKAITDSQAFKMDSRLKPGIFSYVLPLYRKKISHYLNSTAHSILE